MIDFATAMLSWTGATLVPAFIGLLIITLVGRRVRPYYVAAFASGIFFWFFVDTIGGSALLDVNSGFGGGLAQFGVIVLFLVGLVFFFWFDRKRNIFSPSSAIGKYGITIPLLVAMAIGIHGLGEGAAFGATAYSTSSTSLLDAFGGVSAGVAYFLHKGLEPMMIGACYIVYSRQLAGTTSGWLKNSLLLSIVFVIPSILGAITGYLSAFDATYTFALGTGTSIYAIYRLLGPQFSTEGSNGVRQPVRLIIAWALGFMVIYFAALFHS